MDNTAQYPAPAQQPAVPNPPQVVIDPEAPLKSFVATWLLSLLLGALGIDRFYLGKVGTGILKLLTFGGLGIWYLIDLILILVGAARDKVGRPLEGYDKAKLVAWIVTGALVLVGAFSGLVAPSTVPDSKGIGDAAPKSQDAGSTAGTAAEIADKAAEMLADGEAEGEKAKEEPGETEPVAETDAVATTWANETWGTFDTVQASGVGDDIVALPDGATGGIVVATHDGARNFIVSVLDEGNDPTGDLLVNTIGAYQGTASWGINSLGEGETLQITADGAWTLDIQPMGAAPEFVDSGSGDAVFLYDGDAGALTAAHSGERNFIVSENTGALFEMGLLVNEIGTYSGTVPLSAGPSVITVSADGAWTFELK